MFNSLSVDIKIILDGTFPEGSYWVYDMTHSHIYVNINTNASGISHLYYVRCY